MFRRLTVWKLGGLTVAGLCALAAMNAPTKGAQDPNRIEPQQGIEVLTRGPVHEAFGKPVTFDAKPGLVVPKQPPQPIEELPPDEKPEGDNVAWIPGYYAWDEDRNDFIWISGFWRVLPPGQQWQPGYWNRIDGGWQWITGFWTPVASKGVEYFPPPPQSLEIGPSTQPPGDDYIWSPGTWIWTDTRYAWRPGYWIVNRPGWIWTPAHYVWTPCGYVFVDGFWDYSLRRRGLLFAPLAVTAQYYAAPAVFRPSICLDVNILTDHFFCRPSYSHYYFGDYYSQSYLDIGITPWFSFHYSKTRFGGYDPFYSYYSCFYRRYDPGWVNRLGDSYRFRCDNAAFRPPRTLVAQRNIVQNNVTNITNIKNVNVTNVQNVNNLTNVTNVNTLALARPLGEVARDKDLSIKLEKAPETTQKQAAARARELREAAAQRIRLEKEAAASAARAAADRPVLRDKNKPESAAKEVAAKPLTLTLPKSPVAGKKPEEIKGETPPPVPKAAARIGGKAPGAIDTKPGSLEKPVPSGTDPKKETRPTLDKIPKGGEAKPKVDTRPEPPKNTRPTGELKPPTSPSKPDTKPESPSKSPASRPTPDAPKSSKPPTESKPPTSLPKLDAKPMPPASRPETRPLTTPPKIESKPAIQPPKPEPKTSPPSIAPPRGESKPSTPPPKSEKKSESPPPPSSSSAAGGGLLRGERSPPSLSSSRLVLPSIPRISRSSPGRSVSPPVSRSSASPARSSSISPSRSSSGGSIPRASGRPSSSSRRGRS